MSFVLEVDEPLSAGVRRIAHEQAERALEGLGSAEADREAADDAIHDARKRFKKIRAALRLVRHHLGPEVFARENEAWRDAGRQLAEVRESAVLPRTLRSLRDRHGDALAPGPFEEMADRLEAYHGCVLDRVLAEDGPLAEATVMVQAARDRIHAWPLTASDWEAIAPSVRKVYKRGLRRMEDAYEDPSAAAFHEWRKRVKYLWYQLRMLAPVWESVLGEWADVQHDLADDLGEANDLSDLLEQLENGRLDVDGEVATVLTGVATRWRAERWDDARPLGLRLYAESPDEFVERMGTYWTAARRS